MVLSPNAAGEFVTARLETSEDEAEIRALLDVAVLAQAPEAGRGVLKLAANDKAPAELRLLALQTLDVGLVAGWKPLTGDAQLITTLRALMAKEAMRRLVLDIAGKHAITPLGPDVWKLAKSRELPGADRSRAIAIAARLKPSGYSSLLAGLLADEDRAVRQAALAALVDMQDMKTLKPVLSGNGYSAEVRSQTVERLMSATGGALVLLRMLDAKSLSSELEKETVIRAINHPDANVRILFEKFIPVGERPKRLGEAINAEEILSLQGNAKRGEQIFFQSSAAQCKNCHMVRGQGSSVGPDLSLIGKKYERATLLETILDPSKAIAPEFVTYVAETKSGQVFAGFLVEQSEKQVVLKDSKGELVRIPANGIAELLKTEKSVMPELVLRDVTAQDAADLLAYLTSLTDKAGGE